MKKKEKALKMTKGKVSVAANKIKCLSSKPLKQMKTNLAVTAMMLASVPVCYVQCQQRFLMCLCVC